MIWPLIKVVVVYIVVFVPSQNPPMGPQEGILKAKNCSREGSSIVRHFLQTAFKPIFKKFEVKMPLNCPLHFNRDVFKVQELAKLHYRVNLWTCGLCGKSFYREAYLDMHMNKAHHQTESKHETAVCYADFCDVFRCRGYMKKLRQRTVKNHRGAFTRTWGSRQAFYHLGINLHSDLEDEEANDLEDAKKPSNALMTMPPSKVLRALDGKSGDKSDKFIVGVDSSQHVQDPLAFDAALEKSETSSRPRGGSTGSSSQAKRNRRGQIVGKKDSFQEELEEIFSRTLTALEKKLGRKLFNETTSTDNNDEDLEEEKACDPQELQLVQAKCQKLIDDCISPLLIDLADSQFVEMEGQLHRQLCWYLTCERIDEFEGIPNTRAGTRKLPPRLGAYVLMGALLVLLGLSLLVIYYSVWLCFWQMESQGLEARRPQRTHSHLSSKTIASTSSSRPSHLPVFVQGHEWHKTK